VNQVAERLQSVAERLDLAKKVLIGAAESAAGDPVHADTRNEMIGLCPRLDELIWDVRGALQTAKECQP
jgi:hypothetical protein